MRKYKVFSDYVCPFCYIGFAISERFKDDEEDVELEWYPYVLHPGLNGEVKDMNESVDKETRMKAYERIESLGEEYGLIYNNKDYTFDSTRAHKGGYYARENRKFYEYSKLVFETVFKKGENIGDVDVLSDIARQVGLDSDKMNFHIDNGDYDEEFDNALKLGVDLNITSVPTFVLPDNSQVTELKIYEAYKKDLLK